MNTESTAAKSDNTRLKILLVLLVVTIGIFGYDVGIAKRGWENAIAELEKTINDTEKLKTNKTYGPSDVQDMIGRKPVVSGAAKEAPNKIPELLKSADPKDWEHKMGYFEVYQWRRGIPFLKYTLFVSYTGPQQNPVLYQFQPGGELEPVLFRGVKMPTNFNQKAKMAKKNRGAERAVVKAPGAGGKKKHGDAKKKTKAKKQKQETGETKSGEKGNAEGTETEQGKKGA